MNRLRQPNVQLAGQLDFNVPSRGNARVSIAALQLTIPTTRRYVLVSLYAGAPPLFEKPLRYNISFEFRGENNNDPRCCCKERQLDETTHSSVYVCESKLFKCAEYIFTSHASSLPKKIKL
jgi:hypothetical protein